MNHFVARTVMDSAIVLTGLGTMVVYFSVMTCITIQGSNIQLPARIFSDVFLMSSQTDGDAHL